MNGLAKSIKEHIKACFSGLWVQSYEHDTAIEEIAELCIEQDWRLGMWDCDRGVTWNMEKFEDCPDPTAPLKQLRGFIDARPAILILSNYHPFLDSPNVMQVMANTVTAGRANNCTVIILSCKTTIRPELEKLFVVIEHELPHRNELMDIAHGLLEEGETIEDEDTLLDSAAGLTRHEAEGAFSLSVIRNKKMEPGTVWDIKSGALKKAGTLSLHQGKESFDDLGGLDAMKDFCKRALTTNSKNAKARGILMLGVPGAGKSAFAKALGNEIGRPTISLDFGALMGSLVGQTEERTRQALQIVDRMAPCILFADEIEKGLSGATSGGGSGDSGVSQRMLGTLLTWLNDHESDVFFVGTCNDIKALTDVSAGAFVRAERFDGIFFIDLPSGEQRDVIWDMYLKMYGLDGTDSAGFDDEGWTGAEIKSCCRLASLLDISIEEASKMVIPVAKTAKGKIEALREWAQSNALDANAGGIYSDDSAASIEFSRPKKRRLQRAV